MMYKFIMCLLFCFTISQANAQEYGFDEGYADMGFVIIFSTKDYTAAKKAAEAASKKLEMDLDYRGYYYSEDEGLATDSVCGCGEVHGYIPRGRYDHGTYVSIENSDSYLGFSEGYYIVIIASNDKGSEELTSSLDKAKEYYQSAYIKNAPVYVSCMH